MLTQEQFTQIVQTYINTVFRVAVNEGEKHLRAPWRSRVEESVLFYRENGSFDSAALRSGRQGGANFRVIARSEATRHGSCRPTGVRKDRKMAMQKNCMAKKSVF
jgi:hypothetical protein